MTQHPPPRVQVPPGWRRRRDARPGLVVEARGPCLSRSGVAPELSLHCGRVEVHDLDAWRDQAMAELVEHLTDVEVEDADTFDLGGLPVAYRRFSHRLGAAHLISDQWAWLVGRPPDQRGVVLTCSVAREDYPDLCDLFEDVATSVEVVPMVA